MPFVVQTGQPLFSILILAANLLMNHVSKIYLQGQHFLITAKSFTLDNKKPGMWCNVMIVWFTNVASPYAGQGVLPRTLGKNDKGTREGCVN